MTSAQAAVAADQPYHQYKVGLAWLLGVPNSPQPMRRPVPHWLRPWHWSLHTEGSHSPRTMHEPLHMTPHVAQGSHPLCSPQLEMEMLCPLLHQHNTEIHSSTKQGYENWYGHQLQMSADRCLTHDKMECANFWTSLVQLYPKSKGNKKIF